MGKHQKLCQHILIRLSDANVPFDSMCALLVKPGFDMRIRGDHHIFTMPGVEEILNLQPKNGKGRPYQVNQVREVLLKYSLKLALLGFPGDSTLMI